MSERYLIRFLTDDPGRMDWLRITGDGDLPGKVDTGTPETFAESRKRGQIILLLPGTETLLLTAQLPKGTSRQIAHALPFAVEEQLAEEVEQLYFVPGPRGPDGNTPVAAVRREWLHKVLQILEEAGIQPSWAIPEPLLLPWEEGSWSFLDEGDRVVLRYGEYGGMTVEREMLPVILPRLLHEQVAGEPPRMRIWARREAEGLSEYLASLDLEVDQLFSMENGLQVFRPLPQKRPLLDLLRVVRRETGERSKHTGTWRLAAALAFSTLLLHLGVSSYQFWQLNQEQELLRGKIQSVFQEAFPEVKRVVDPLVQAEQLLQKRRSARGLGDDAFLDMLYQLGDAIKHQRTLKLTGVEFRDGLMQVQMKGDSISRIENLKQRLEKEGDLQAEILSAVSRDNGVDAKLRIKRSS